MRARRGATCAVLVLSLIGCGGDAIDGDPGESDLAMAHASSGKHLFTKATFGGNGRTCSTCHGDETGTFSPDDAAARYAADPSDPLFLPLDSDDGVTGASYDRMIQFATVLVGLPLPPGVTIAEDPAATSVTVERNVPSTLNAPALDPVVMWDGREPSLENQASDAILGHAEAPHAAAASDLARIAAYERDKLFSSKALEMWAKGDGPAPELPTGVTDAEIRGQAFFADDGLCGKCHGGPMLNETTAFGPGGQAGQRFSNVRVSTFNARGLPMYTFLFPGPEGPVSIVSSDPGRALITGDSKDANRFKIPTLWNIANTAPYFHDGSARTLEEVAAHYAQFFAVVSKGATILTAQDQADIVAYLELL
jgi:cytochrome c peroxidase